MDWRDVEDKLQQQAEEVCRHLLPNGRREGAEWVCGNIDGNPGKSFKVNLAGKVGIWRDFAGDEGGKSLMGLWCSVKRKPFKECIVEAKGFLGIRDDYERRVRSYGDAAGGAGGGARPEEEEQKVAEAWKRCQPLTQGGPVWNYLVEKRRMEPVILEAYGVREMVSHGRWVMVFPYWVPAEEEKLQIGVPTEKVPTWLKFELLERVDGKKKEWTSRGPEKCLWGTQVAESAWFRNCRSVLICEGEKDAVSWATYGCAQWGVLPVSVPFGAKYKGQVKGQPSPNREWLDRCWDWLQGFETVFVAMDSDEKGKRAAADIITEIGPRRCRLVELPEKLRQD